MTQYPIDQSQDDRFTRLVYQVEEGTTVELTRCGQRIAVILSAEEYDHLAKPTPGFGESVLVWRKKYDVNNWDDNADIDEIFNVRDKSPESEAEL